MNIKAIIKKKLKETIKIRPIHATIIILFFACNTVKGQVYAISSTYESPWQEAAVKVSKRMDKAIQVNTVTKTEKQVVDGFGACFNELGWEALSVLHHDDIVRVMKNVFDTSNGCKFNICRMPIGANDFSLGYYSLNDHYLDFKMDSFSLERDKQRLIPYIAMARQFNPNLKIWGSPWSPPAWMKENMHYGGKVINNNWGQYQGGNQEDLYDFNHIIAKDKYFEAYSKYFVKYIEGYKSLGIPISAIHPQNEVFANQLFPSCVWDADELAVFMADYLIPAVKASHPDVKIWLGTINSDSVEYVQKVLNYKKLENKIEGIGLQWAGLRMIDTLHVLYPELKLMQTESECNNGMNEWFTAEHTWDLIYETFSNGGNSYMYWNLVLDEIGLSHWMWRQNSMISVNKYTKEVNYNPEFYLMKHFSYFVQSGAKRIETIDNGDLLAFLNPDNSLVVIVANKKNKTDAFSFTWNKKYFSMQLKPKSFYSVIVSN